ncbi:MAG: NHLP bacteriocin export ABC transporter permease/ATPase subunit [Reyranella sp.]|nr:NHLP bacteriocin export ABC transporter permease/ATPase subunit [Reyranella sp.]
MNVPDPKPGLTRSTELAALLSPQRLRRSARLYATVVDAHGAHGRRYFMAQVPEGAAVLPLTAPGVSFLLVDDGILSAEPLLVTGPIDAQAIDAWYRALLSCPGQADGEAAAAPMAAGEKQVLPQGKAVTAREVVWLQADRPVLRYVATRGFEPSAAMSLLVLADQITAEATEEGEVRAVTSASLLLEGRQVELHAPSTVLATRIAARLIRYDAAVEQRAGDRLVRDEAEVSQSLRRLGDAAALRPSVIAPALIAANDPLVSALSAIAMREGFNLRLPPTDRREALLQDRLERIGTASGFRTREITLDGTWWTEEGPPFLALVAADGHPRAVIWKRRHWRIIDPETSRETLVDAATAATLMLLGFMFYPLLPERISMRDVARFSFFGARGDVRHLFIGAAAAALSAWVIPIATGAVLGVAVPDGRTDLLTDMMIMLVAAAVGNTGFQVVRATALTRLGSYVDRRLQAAVWDRVMRLRTSFFRRYTVGDLAARIVGIDTIRRLLAGQSLNTMIGSTFSLASLGIMAIYDVSLTVFAVGYAVVAAVFLFLLGRAKMRLDGIVQARKGVVTGLLMEILGGIVKLRVAAAEQRAFSLWSNAFADQRTSDAQSGIVGAWQVIASASLPILGTFGVLAIAGGGSHPTDVADFAAFNGAFAIFTAAILNLATVMNSAIAAVPLLARVQPVFEAPLEVEERRVDPGTLDGHIAVRNLSFRYSTDGPWTLANINFEVRPGTSVAIVGVSGSGKSALLRLLLGFEVPERGGVYYDGKDLETLDLRQVRRQIGTVLETAVLIPGTIFENIAGGAQLTREQVMEATRLAGLDADVAAMPMGVDTMVTEGGSQLSGGQRQRVMIARALVRRPRLIYFDEATSALDNRTQVIVGESLAKMNATRIVIAHRLSTIRSSDQIIVLEGGQIVEAGTYDELVDSGGAFYRLVRRQML